MAYEPKNIIVKKEFLGKSLDVQQCNVEESGYQIQEIREIKGNSALYQMAVKWRDDEQYYIYYNYEYEPKDMKQYLQDLGMENYSVVARLYLDVDKENSDIKLTDHTLIYTNGVEEMLKKYVFSKSGKYMCESNDSCNLRIEMYIQELGMYIYVDFTRDNHIRIKDVETTKNYKFQFGEENLKTLQTCIENEMTGYLVESEAEEDIDNEETIMSTVLPLE